MQKTSNIAILNQYPLQRLMTIAARRLDDELDGNEALCTAGDLWNLSPDRYRGMGLVDQLLRMALHPNGMAEPADLLRMNLKEHFNAEEDTLDALNYKGLCKLQAFNAIHLLYEISCQQPQEFEKAHIGKLLTYTHLAEGNVVCASGNESAYQCIHNLAQTRSDLFTRQQAAFMASKSDLDLRPVTRTDHINPYHDILYALGIMPAIVRPISNVAAPVHPIKPTPQWRLAVNDARFVR